MPLLCAAALVGMPASVIAQVGLTQWKSPTLAQPATLVYPTDTVSRSTTFGPFTLEVAADAPVTPGRHRLVVLSHGTAGSPLPDHALAAQLARARRLVGCGRTQGGLKTFGVECRRRSDSPFIAA